MLLNGLSDIQFHIYKTVKYLKAPIFFLGDGDDSTLQRYWVNNFNCEELRLYSIDLYEQIQTRGINNICEDAVNVPFSEYLQKDDISIVLVVFGTCSLPLKQVLDKIRLLGTNFIHLYIATCSNNCKMTERVKNIKINRFEKTYHLKKSMVICDDTEFRNYQEIVFKRI